jgi:hypothetical protein
MDGYHTTFNLITMSVDAEYEVVVDAALAFGGLDQHDALTPTVPQVDLGTSVNSTKRRVVSGQQAPKSSAHMLSRAGGSVGWRRAVSLQDWDRQRSIRPLAWPLFAIDCNK